MSVRSELEELVEWISELKAKAQPVEPERDPLPRKTWQGVRKNLEAASETFGKARVALAGEGQEALAEFAEDLQHEAEGLALRAHLLSRRAPEAKAEPAPPRPQSAVVGRETTREPASPPATTEPDEDPPPPPVKELVRSAGNTVETAHAKLEDVEHPDAVTQAFEAELDVLAEMTLSLRHRCERLEAEPDPAKRTR